MIDIFYNEVEGDLAIDDDLISTLCGRATPPPPTEPVEHGRELVAQLGTVLRAQGLETILTRFAQAYCEKNNTQSQQAVDPFKLSVAAILLGLAWKPLTGRRITRETAQELATYLALNGIIVGVSPVRPQANVFLQKLQGAPDAELLSTDFAATCFQLLFNRAPGSQELFAFNALLDLTVTNGPGALSVKGAKESVSARNHISTAYAGFLTNTGLAHGGNGFEALSFLLGVFAGTDPYKIKAGDLDSTLRQLAVKAVDDFAARKRSLRGNAPAQRIPCINHPVFCRQAGKP